ncbi:MAG TPA: NAD(P)H-binding protein, partial [bacterium]|nr:NAD(P)H-binding protein [bacterium]
MLTLVTGANGHIGSRIVKRLLDRGRRVRALVRKSSNLAGLLNPAGQ